MVNPFSSLSSSVSSCPHPQDSQGPGCGGGHTGNSLWDPERLSPHPVPVLSRECCPGELLKPLWRRNILQPLPDHRTFWKLLFETDNGLGAQWSEAPLLNIICGLLEPGLWDSLLEERQVCQSMCAKSFQLCPTLCNLMDCNPSGSSVHGILQARILEWVAVSFSRGSFWLRDCTHVSYISCIGIGRQVFVCLFTTEGHLVKIGISQKVALTYIRYLVQNT